MESNFQELRTAGKFTISLVSDQDDIFQTDPTHSEIVKARFDRYHVAATQSGSAHSDSWWLMDIQTQTMPGAMKESLHSPVDLAGWKSSLPKEGKNFLMNFHPIDAVPNHPIGHPLPCLHGYVSLFEPF